MASLYRRSGVYYLGFTANGRRVDKSLKTRDRVVAKRIQVELEAKVAQGKFGIQATKRVPMERFKNQYLEHCDLQKAPSTVAEDRRRLGRFLGFVKKEYVNHIDAADLQAYQTARGKEVSLSTLKRDMDLVRASLKWAHRQGMIPENPAAMIDPVHVKVRATPRFLDAEEKKKLLEAAEGTPIYPLLLFALYTGCRVGEIQHLEWSDTDFHRKAIRIRPKAGWSPKDREERVIPMHQRVIDLLGPMKNGTSLVFPSANGTPLERPNLHRWIQKLREDSGIAAVTWNVCRHTFASELVQAGVSLFKVSRLLGHASSRVTERFYATLAPDSLHEEVGRLA